MIRIFLLLLYALAQPLSAFHRATESQALGVQTIEYVDEARQRPLVVELWYPTAMKGPIEELKNDIWIHPDEVRNAPFLHGKTKRPLILMSHGHRGERRDMSWLADSLVKAGYVVAAVDHYGDMRFHFDLYATVCFWNRPLDFTFLLDQLEKEEPLSSEIDFERVGFVGYSLGGMTGLALAGGEAQNIQAVLDEFKSFYPMDEELLGKLDLSLAKKSYREPRIKSMLLLCPAVHLYPAESLKQIKMPFAMVAALEDEVLPFKKHAYQIVQNMVPKKLKMLREGLSHSALVNRLSDVGRALLHKQYPKETPAAIYREVSSFAVDFFRSNFQ